MTSKIGFNIRAWILLLGCLTLTTIGCQPSNRLPVNGKVTFDGEAVNYGYIHFTPTENTTGPTAGANIKDGAYQIPPNKGLFQGSYLVAVQGWKSGDGISIDPVTGETFDGGALKQFLPAIYNTKSELTIQVTPGESTHDFELIPRPRR